MPSALIDYWHRYVLGRTMWSKKQAVRLNTNASADMCEGTESIIRNIEKASLKNLKQLLIWFLMAHIPWSAVWPAWRTKAEIDGWMHLLCVGRSILAPRGGRRITLVNALPPLDLLWPGGRGGGVAGQYLRENFSINKLHTSVYFTPLFISLVSKNGQTEWIYDYFIIFWSSWSLHKEFQY